MNVPKHWRESPQRYRMEAGKCRKCERIFFPGRLVCPECGHTGFDMVKLSGKGKLHTFTVIRTAPSGFTDFAPYAVGIVELDEGIRILGQITDCDPDSLQTGDRLTSKFRRMNDEGKTGMIMYSYKFVPDNGI
ncbi:MAG: Zn-ribbon domain-containing OB-fold protein [Bacteroidales bacterium]|nr:MAG: Zn-ribbon domain-containing OB-fold protein [Bacteroidales bacterium]